MALKVAMNVRTMDSNGANYKRLLSYVNPNYIAAAKNDGTLNPEPALPVGYTSFFAWADYCVRSLNGLTYNTFVTSEIVATWDVNEELAD